MRILHFHDDWGAGALRIQRFAQSELNMGMQPIILVKHEEPIIKKTGEKPPSPWIPGMDKVPVEYFRPNRNLSFLLPSFSDKVGLKKIFKNHNCDLVHAHGLVCAYYSYRTGLPTLFDDWEYFYEHYDIQPIASSGLPKLSSFLSYIRRFRAKKIVKELLRRVPVIVTNQEVEARYRQLGATSISWVPNVPISYEKEYASAVDVKKRERITTCYAGSLSRDDKTYLRNTSGVRELWNEHDIGDLLVLEGENRVPHLDVLRKLRECHFNLLYWKPLPIHRYFIQNKPFLASVVGVPTIISSSLKATIDLLGDYALRVNSLEDIPEVIKNYDISRKYSLNPKHLWEHYESKIAVAYEKTVQR